MGSNNYAEVITDPIKARQVLANLKRLATLGETFKVLQFNPEVDRFPISLGRESNFPTLLDVEEGGATLDGPKVKGLWSGHNGAVEAVSFGNTYVGVFYQSDGLSYMAIPAGKSNRG
jgi:hypothetical protein